MPFRRIVLDQSQLDAIAAQIGAGGGAEICGLLAGEGERVRTVLPVRNVSRRPAVHFEMDGAEFVRHVMALEAGGWSLLAIYHSHPPGAELYPSATDIANANYPDSAVVIVGPGDGGRMAARAFYIVDGAVEEIGVDVVL